MEWEHALTLLSILVPISITLISLNTQTRQELKRNQQAQDWREKEQERQREWSVDDRNNSRKWSLTDRQIEEKRTYLLAHKGFVDDFIKNVLLLTTRVDGVGVLKGQKIKMMDKVLEQIQECGYHVLILNDEDLQKEFTGFVAKLREFFEERKRGNQQKSELAIDQLTVAAAKITKKMQDIIIDGLQPDDWK
jgi:hypothetical protein